MQFGYAAPEFFWLRCNPSRSSPNFKDALDDIEEKLRALLLSGLRGDSAAYRRFLTQSSVYARAYFRRRLGAFPDDVEDLVQETLLALHNQRDTYRPSQRLMPWFYAIARYKLIDSLRSHGPRRALEVPLSDDMNDSAFVESGSAAAESRRDLLKLLATLPDRYRLPIVRVKLEGRSVAQTAYQLGMSESAVKVGIHRGLKLLARRTSPSR